MNDIFSARSSPIAHDFQSGPVRTGVRAIAPSRLVLLLLACATAASAIPLSKGNTWTWLLTNRANGANTWRTATILDSSKGDSGTLWRIVGRDSVGKSQDTGTILQRKDGSQAWWNLSRWLPWEPAPARGADTVGTTSMTAHPYPWGAAFLAIAGRGLQGAFSLDSRSQGTSPSRTCGGSFNEFEGATSNCPQESFDHQGLLLRARIREALVDTDRGAEWMLLTPTGSVLDSNSQFLHVPDSGTRLVWLETSGHSSYVVGRTTADSSSTLRTWTVGSKSEGEEWTTIRIEERFDTLPSSILTIRWNRRTGQRMPARSINPTPDESWWKLWSDTSAAGTGVRSWSFTKGDGLTGYHATQGSNWSIVSKSNQMLSSTFRTNVDTFNGSVHSYTTSFTRLLLSIDGAQVNPAPVASNRVSNENRSSVPLSTLALLHPGLPVRWTDSRGRHGQFPASELSRRAPASGLLFLEATLPDGTPWRARLPVPLR